MANALDVLRERGFLQQITYEDELYRLLGSESVAFYVGFDPTADSLHIGHYIPVMAMAHMQRAGHRPIALVGGGTVMVGDPSGKTDMRQMLTREQIDRNVAGLRAQLGRLLDFEGPTAARIVNNADWLLGLNYVDFLREIGVHFSVNRMLTADCYRMRMEKGLTFLEFNYMLMQAYDFLHLYREQGVRLQMGGDDQWSNILAGADLIRRKERGEAFACTFSLLTTSDGTKMGKTVKGALWLDAARTTPYEFYQYWRNIEDASVRKALAMLTFLPMDEVNRLGSLQGSAINQAKARLAWEVTALIHGKEEADRAHTASEALFGAGSDDSDMPTTTLTQAQFDAGRRVADLLVAAGIAPSLSEARRLITQGAVQLNDQKITRHDAQVDLHALGERSFVLRKGKKVFHRIVVEG